jgi:hypothetical protein
MCVDKRFCKWFPIRVIVKSSLPHLHDPKNMALFYFFTQSHSPFAMLQWHQSSLNPLCTPKFILVWRHSHRLLLLLTSYVSDMATLPFLYSYFSLCHSSLLEIITHIYLFSFLLHFPLECKLHESRACQFPQGLLECWHEIFTEWMNGCICSEQIFSFAGWQFAHMANERPK